MAKFINMFPMDMTNGPAIVKLQNLYYGNALANRIGVMVTNRNKPFTLGGSCAGTAIRADGKTVPVIGVVSGNEAYIELPQAAYAIEGDIRVFVTVSNGTNTTTLLDGNGYVTRTQTTSTVDPGTIIPSVEGMIEDIEEAVASIPASAENLKAAVAETFNPNKPYVAGDYVWNEGILYEFATDHAAGSWTGTDAFNAIIGDDVNDLKSTFGTFIKSSGTVLINEETVAMNNILFTSDDVDGNSIIYYSLTTEPGYAAFIELLDENDQRLAWYGKGASDSIVNSYQGSFMIPNGFSKAVTNGASENTQISFDYLVIVNANYDPLRNVGYFQGSYDSYGTIIESQNMLISGLISAKPGTIFSIFVGGGYKCEITEWETIGNSYTHDSEFSDGVLLYSVKDANQIIAIKKAAGGEISPSESPNVKIFTFKSQREQIKTTNDITDRKLEITRAINQYGFVELGPGPFYINSPLSIPQGATLKGQGDSTVLIVGDNSITSFIIPTTECTIKDLKIKGTANGTPASLGSMNAIAIRQYNCENRIENVSFESFTGCGILAANTYNQSHNSNAIINCRFNMCGCGIFIGSRAEAFSVSSCTVLNSYIGIHCIGGNNRIDGCLIRGCTYGFDMDVTASNNDGHSTFYGLVIIHNTHAINISNVIYGVIFNGCTIFYGDIVIGGGAKGITFNGCEFGSLTSIDGDGSIGTRILNSVFGNMSESNINDVAIINCAMLDGTIVAENVATVEEVEEYLGL